MNQPTPFQRRPSVPATPTVNPDQLRQMLENNAREKSFDTSYNIAVGFVNRLIENGSIKSVKDADVALQEGFKLVNSKLETQMFQLGLANLEAALKEQAINANGEGSK